MRGLHESGDVHDASAGSHLPIFPFEEDAFSTNKIRTAHSCIKVAPLQLVNCLI